MRIAKTRSVVVKWLFAAIFGATCVVLVSPMVAVGGNVDPTTSGFTGDFSIVATGKITERFDGTGPGIPVTCIGDVYHTGGMEGSSFEGRLVVGGFFVDTDVQGYVSGVGGSNITLRATAENGTYQYEVVLAADDGSILGEGDFSLQSSLKGDPLSGFGFGRVNIH